MKNSLLVISLAFVSVLSVSWLSFPRGAFAPSSWSGWTKTYGGADADVGSCIIQTIDGGYAVAGSTNSSTAGGYDAWLLKVDADGNAEWSVTYGGDRDDRAFSLVRTADDGYALAGFTNSYGAEDYDFWLVKTGSSGHIEWNMTCGGVDDDYAYSIVQTGDGGYALGGWTKSYGMGDYQFWLVKTDAYGNMIWDRAFQGAYSALAYSMIQTNDGGYALAGFTSSVGVFEDFCLVKADASGNLQWNKTYGESKTDWAYSVVQTSDGGYALTGYTESFGVGSRDFWLVKTDENGTMLWDTTYGEIYSDKAFSLVQTLDGGYAIVGVTQRGLSSNDGDIWLVKVDAIGVTQWIQTAGGAEWDAASCVIQTADGGYALTGNTYSFGAGLSDLWIAKTDESGTIQGFDTEAPRLEVLSPQNATYKVNSIPLVFTVNELASWIGYSLDGKNNMTINGNTTLAGMSEGKHTIVIHAADMAGNTGLSGTIHFTVDTIPPSIEILSPTNKSYTTSSILLSFSTDEPTSWKGYSIDDKTNETISGNTTLSGLHDGLHDIQVYANDIAGNTGVSEKVHFTVSLQEENSFLPPVELILFGILIVAILCVAGAFFYRRRK